MPRDCPEAVRSNRRGLDARYRKQMQIVSRLLAFTLDRWCSHRAAKNEQSITYTPSEVLPSTPFVKNCYEPFILHSILAQPLEDWTLPWPRQNVESAGSTSATVPALMWQDTHRNVASWESTARPCASCRGSSGSMGCMVSTVKHSKQTLHRIGGQGLTPKFLMICGLGWFGISDED